MTASILFAFVWWVGIVTATGWALLLCGFVIFAVDRWAARRRAQLRARRAPMYPVRPPVRDEWESDEALEAMFSMPARTPRHERRDGR